MSEPSGVSPDLDREAGNAAPSGGDTLSDTVDAVAPVGEWVEAIQEVVQHHASKRPYVTLLAAGTVGYVLAAGLPPFLFRLALGAGGRLVAARIVADLFDGDR